MTDKDKQSIVYKLIAGYTFIDVAGVFYIIDTPTDKLINESLSVYNRTISEYRFEPWLDEEEVEFYLIKNGLATFQDKKNIEELQKSMDACKLELFQNFNMPPKMVTKIRNRLELIKSSYNQKINTQHMLDRYTLRGFADEMAELYLFSKVLLNSDYKPIEVEVPLLERIIHIYKEQLVSATILREIARTEPWKCLWSTNKECFRVMGEDQKMLVMFTKMYENINEHPDKPPQAVIDDDDMLDGWFIEMRNKRAADGREPIKNALERKHGNASDIIVFTQDPELAQQVEAMNDLYGKSVKREIQEKLKTQPMLRDEDIETMRLPISPK